MATCLEWVFNSRMRAAIEGKSSAIRPPLLSWLITPPACWDAAKRRSDPVDSGPEDGPIGGCRSRPGLPNYVRSITKETFALTRKFFTVSFSTVAWNSLMYTEVTPRSVRVASSTTLRDASSQPYSLSPSSSITFTTAMIILPSARVCGPAENGDRSSRFGRERHDRGR